MMKIRFNSFMALFMVFVVLWSLLAMAPRPQSHQGDNPLRAYPNGRPHIVAHAGGNMEFPDNTLEAFYNAYSIDANVIMEMDVALTKDRVVVLTHDRTFDRKTSLLNATVSETRYQDLIEQEIDFGYENPIDRPNGFNVTGEFIRYTNYFGETVTPLDVSYPPGVVARHPEKFLATTLEEMIIAFPNNYFVVELKQYGELGLELLDEVIALMERLEENYNTFERITLASFHEDIYDAFRTLKETDYPFLNYSPQNRSLTLFYILHVPSLSFFYRDPVITFHIPMRQGNFNLATRYFVRTAQRHNIAVHYWTINNEEDMRFLIDLGVDGILTDRPTLLKSILDELFDE